MSEPSSGVPELRAQVKELAAAVGLPLSPERLDALVAQAGPYFEMIRGLDGLPAANEPAAIFRLDGEEAR
jgi:hypothetical protein